MTIYIIGYFVIGAVVGVWSARHYGRYSAFYLGLFFWPYWGYLTAMNVLESPRYEWQKVSAFHRWLEGRWND